MSGIFQLTAVFMDSEIAYAESESDVDAMNDLSEQVQNSPYYEFTDSLEVICLMPSGNRASYTWSDALSILC